MTERRRPNPGGQEGGPVDPLQRARERFERQAGSPRYDASALQRELDKVRDVGAKLGKTPGELYAELAGYAGMAAEIAGQRGTEAEQQAFYEQQQTFSETSEQLSPGGIIVPNSPSNPQRTTGRASG